MSEYRCIHTPQGEADFGGDAAFHFNRVKIAIHHTKQTAMDEINSYHTSIIARLHGERVTIPMLYVATYGNLSANAWLSQTRY